MPVTYGHVSEAKPLVSDAPSRGSHAFKTKYLIRHIDDLVYEDRMEVLNLLHKLDGDNIKTLGIGSAYNLDKATADHINQLFHLVYERYNTVDPVNAI